MVAMALLKDLSRPSDPVTVGRLPMAFDRTRTLRGALAGAAAAAVWAAQQALDERVFGVPYDDCELLGKWVTRGPAWGPVGVEVHFQDGAAFGAPHTDLAARLPLA